MPAVLFFIFAASADESWNEKTAGIFALRPRAQIHRYEKRSIRHPGSSNTEPRIFECGVANAVPDEEHIGCCATETASTRRTKVTNSASGGVKPVPKVATLPAALAEPLDAVAIQRF